MEARSAGPPMVISLSAQPFIGSSVPLWPVDVHRRAGARRDGLPGIALVVHRRGARAGRAGAGGAIVLRPSARCRSTSPCRPSSRERSGRPRRWRPARWRAIRQARGEIVWRFMKSSWRLVTQRARSAAHSGNSRRCVTAALRRLTVRDRRFREAWRIAWPQFCSRDVTKPRLQRRSREASCWAAWTKPNLPAAAGGDCRRRQGLCGFPRTRLPAWCAPLHGAGPGRAGSIRRTSCRKRCWPFT